MVNATEPQTTLEVRADSQGDWQAQLPQNLTPGLHTVVVTTEDGESQEVAMYSLQKETRTLTNTIKELPASYVYPLFFLFFLVLILAWTGLRLLSARKTAPRQPKMQNLSVILIILSVFCATVFMGYVVWDMSKAQTSGSVVGRSGSQAMERNAINSLSGAVMDPWSGSPVAGIKLNFGDVTITTQDGGRYNFSSLPADALIKVSYASATKDAWVKVSADGNGMMDIPFEPKSFEAVLDVLRAEAQGKLSQIYAKLPDGLKSKTKESDFMGSYAKTATDLEAVNSDLVLNKMEVVDNYIDDVNQLTYPRAWLLDMELNGVEGRYGVVIENGNPKVFRR